MRILLATMACTLPLTAAAQPLTVGAQAVSEKACILAAAEKLPVIPGLAVMSGLVKPLQQEDAAKRLVSAFGSDEDAVVALNDAFGFMDGKLRESVQYHNSANGSEQLKSDLIAALGRKITSANTVEISIQAVDIEAVYGSICAAGPNGLHVSTPTILR